MMPLGLIIAASSHGPGETMERVAAAVRELGMSVVARIDHADAATKVGLTLRPTEVLVFGNPKAGTPLMQSSATIAIDLPLKVLVWQDDGGMTWLAYDDPNMLARRHGIDPATTPTIAAMAKLLASIAVRATAPDAR
jgi:uncharacterized protein (DUF302 family)